MSQNEKIDECIVNGTFLENNEYQRVYLGSNAHKISIAQLVFQVGRKKATSVLLNLLVKQALEKGDAVSLRKSHDIKGFHHGFIIALESINSIENSALDKIARALTGLDDVSDKDRYWNEFYDYKRDIIELDAKGKYILSDASRLILSNVTRWEEYAAFLRASVQKSNSPIDWSRSYSMVLAIEDILQQRKKTQVGSVRPEIVDPETLLHVLYGFRSDWKLANVQCSIEELDKYCAHKLVKESDTLKVLETLLVVAFLDHAERMRMCETLKELKGIGIREKNNSAFVNAYLALLEAVSECQVEVDLTRDNIDVFWSWALEQDDEECLARALILTWRYGGFPYNENQVKKYLSKCDASYARLKDLGRIWPRYFTKEELITRLESMINNFRDEFLIEELYKQVKGEAKS